MPRTQARTRLADRRVWLFGALRVAGPDEPDHAARPISGERGRALLAWLALRPGTVCPRETVAEALWPDAASAASRRHLSDTLYRLRTQLGAGWLEVGEEHIALVDAGSTWTDVAAFEHLADSRHEPDVVAAIALAQDELLTDVYDTWTVATRERLRELQLSALAARARLAADDGRLDDAIASWRRVCAIEPLREQAYGELMELLERAGRPLEALATYRRMAAVLREELDIDPPSDAVARAVSLEAQFAQRKSRTKGNSGLPAGTPRVVGRLVERTKLLARLDRADEARGGAVVLHGPSGIGTTTLLDELRSTAAGRGWAVFDAPREADADPFRGALAAALHPDRLARLPATIQPAWTALARRALPEHSGAPIGLSASRLPALDVATTARALSRLLHALADERPHLITVDTDNDVPAATWELVRAMHDGLLTSPVLLVFASSEAPPAGFLRPSTVRPHATEGGTRDSRNAAPDLVLVSGMPASELQALATEHGHGRLRQDEVAELAELSGGNPQIALACLAAGWRHGVRPTEGLAELERLLTTRLAALSVGERSALEAAALLDEPVPEALWAETSGLGDDAVSVLHALVGSGLVRHDDAFIRFANGAMRRLIAETVAPQRRRTLHRRALAFLDEHHVDRPMYALRHARGAGDHARVAELSLIAGARALERHDAEAAVAAFGSALDVLSADDRERRLEAVRGRLSAFRQIGDREGQAEEVQRLTTLAHEVGDSAHRAEAAYQASELAAVTGDLERAEALATAGLADAREGANAHAEAMLREALAYAARDRGDMAAAAEHIEAAHALYRTTDDAFGIGTTLDKLANLAYYRGEAAVAERGHAEAARLLETAGAPVQAANARSGMAMAIRHTGRLEEARAIHEQVLAVMEDLALPVFAMYQRVNLGNLDLESGDPLAAVEHYEESLALAERVEDPRMRAMTLNNLGAAYLQLGDPETGLMRYTEARDATAAHGYMRGVGYAEMGRARNFMAAGRFDEAARALDHAVEVLDPQDDRVPHVETLALRGEVLRLCGKPSDAVNAARGALALSRETDKATLLQELHLVLGRGLIDEGRHAEGERHLTEAIAHMEATAQRLPSAERARFLERVALNRATRNAAIAAGRSEERRLVRRTVPLGRALHDEDYVVVRWTVAAPGDERGDGTSACRRRALQRMVAQAAEAGAAPTDSDLAAALGVSRRTILRDMNALEDGGVLLPTRRRRGVSDEG